jgi:predicted amidophosphoribosyltransferase
MILQYNCNMGNKICERCFSENRAAANFCRRCAQPFSKKKPVVYKQPSDVIICKSCNRSLLKMAKFCNRCGAQIKSTQSSQPQTIKFTQEKFASCPVCNKNIPSNAKFCRSCGHRIVSKEPVTTSFVRNHQKQTPSNSQKLTREVSNINQRKTSPSNRKVMTQSNENQNNSQTGLNSESNKRSDGKRSQRRTVKDEKVKPNPSIHQRISAEVNNMVTTSADALRIKRNQDRIKANLKALIQDAYYDINRLKNPTNYSYKELIDLQEIIVSIDAYEKEAKEFKLQTDLFKSIRELNEEFYDIELIILEHYTEFVADEEFLNIKSKFKESQSKYNEIIHHRELSYKLKDHLKLIDMKVDKIIELFDTVPEKINRIKYAKGWNYELRQAIEAILDYREIIIEIKEELSFDAGSLGEVMQTMGKINSSVDDDSTVTEFKELLNILKGNLPEGIDKISHIIAENYRINKQFEKDYSKLLDDYMDKMQEIIDDIGYNKIRDFQAAYEDPDTPVIGDMSLDYSEDTILDSPELEEEVEEGALKPLATLRTLKLLKEPIQLIELKPLSTIKELNEFSIDLNESEVNNTIQTVFPNATIYYMNEKYDIQLSYGNIREFTLSNEEDKFQIVATKKNYTNEFVKVSIESEAEFSIQAEYDEIIDIETTPTMISDKIYSQNYLLDSFLQINGYKNMFWTKHGNELQIKLVFNEFSENNLQQIVGLIQVLDSIVNTI